MNFLDIRSLGKRYGDATALADIDLGVRKGSRTAIVGPSGSGKTTLLRIIAGFETQDAGRIVLDGVELADGPKAMPAHRRGIGFVPQDGALFPHLDVAGNIGFGLAKEDAGRARRIGELMALVDLEPRLAQRFPHELSGGQQQRVALARALAREPRLMLLDEPFSALDTGLRAAMRKAVANVLELVGITAILVTHDQAEALSFADQIAVMRQGRLAQVGSPVELYRHPVDSEVAAFLGDMIVLPARIEGVWATCALGRLRLQPSPPAGATRIMIRPEQVRLGDAGPGLVEATVAALEFSGANSFVELRLYAGSVTKFAVPCSSAALPTIGDTVSVSVAGTVHAFAPD